MALGGHRQRTPNQITSTEGLTAMASTAGNISLRTPKNISDFLTLSAAAGERGTPCHQAPEAWFNKATQDDAAARCLKCPLMDGCLEFALTSKQTDGVWGGTTPLQRQEILAQQKRRQRAIWARERAARAAATEPTLDDAIFGALAS